MTREEMIEDIRCQQVAKRWADIFFARRSEVTGMSVRENPLVHRFVYEAYLDLLKRFTEVRAIIGCLIDPKT